MPPDNVSSTAQEDNINERLITAVEQVSDTAQMAETVATTKYKRFRSYTECNGRHIT